MKKVDDYMTPVINESNETRTITICMVNGRSYTYKGSPEFVIERMQTGEIFQIMLISSVPVSVVIQPYYIVSVEY